MIIFLTVTHAVRALQWQACQRCASVFPMATCKADDNGDKETTKPTQLTSATTIALGSVGKNLGFFARVYNEVWHVESLWLGCGGLSENGPQLLS